MAETWPTSSFGKMYFPSLYAGACQHREAGFRTLSQRAATAQPVLTMIRAAMLLAIVVDGAAEGGGGALAAFLVSGCIYAGVARERIRPTCRCPVPNHCLYPTGALMLD